MSVSDGWPVWGEAPGFCDGSTDTRSLQLAAHEPASGALVPVRTTIGEVGTDMRAWRQLVAGCGILLLCVLALPSSPAAAQGPQRIVINTTSLYDTLDPHLVLDTERAAIRLNFYDALYRWQDGPVRVVPWLAQSYTLSEDGKVFRFTLRKGARFHDGSEVEAADVVYSVERILAFKKRGLSPLLTGLVNPGSTKAIDASTVEFSLSRASALFLTLLPEVHIVNSKLLKSHEVNNDWGSAWLSRNEAGSGAYALDRFDPGQAVVAKRFEGHWNQSWGRKPVDELEVRTVLDTETSMEALLKGTVQIVEGPLLPHQKRQAREAKDVSLLENDGPRIFVGLLDNAREALKSLEVRRALTQAFNYDAFMHSALGLGAAGVARVPLPLPPAFASPASMAAAAGPGSQQYNLEAARAALAKLKAPLGELTIGAVAGDVHSERAALIMLDGLSKLGVSARIVAQPWPAIANRMRDEKQMFDILFLWQGPRYLEPNNWVGEMYDCDLFGAGNASWYCNKEVDRLIKEARTTADAKVRTADFEKAAVMVAKDAGGIFIATARAAIAHAKRIKGLRYAPIGETLEWRSLSLE